MHFTRYTQWLARQSRTSYSIPWFLSDNTRLTVYAMQLHQKYSRAKEMLAHEKRLRRTMERERKRHGSERTHIHYVIDGLPPSDKDRRAPRSRRSSRSADDGGSDEEGYSQESQDGGSEEEERAAHRDSEDDVGSPSVGSVRGENSGTEGRFEPEHSEKQARHRQQHPQTQQSHPRGRGRDENNHSGAVCYDILYEAHRQHYEERELCRGNYDVAQPRERTAGGDSRGKHDGMRWRSQPWIVSHPMAGATTRVASTAY